MKILYLTTSFPKISESFILNEVCSLIESGHEVKIISINKPSETLIHGKFELFGLNDKVYQLPRLNQPRIPKYLLAAGMLSRRFISLLPALNFLKFGRDSLNLRFLFLADTYLNASHAGPFDVLNCHFGNNLSFAGFLRRSGLFKGPVICTFHGRDVNRYANSGSNEYYREYSPVLDSAIVNSQFLKKQLIKTGIPESKISILPMAVDTDFFSRTGYNTHDGGVLRLISIGRLSLEKGFDTLISAIDYLVHNKGCKNIHLKIIGNGELSGELTNLVIQHKLSDYISFEGAKTQEECRNLLRTSNLFVLCSRKTDDSEESQGIVLQEAQSVKLPVVASRIGGIPEGVIDGITGVLCRENSAEQFADAIESFVTGEHDLREMGERAREHMLAKYQISSRIKKLESILFRRIPA